MKRPNSSDSPISIFPTSPLGEEKDDDCGEDDLCYSGHAAAGSSSEKKRRLSADQVHALEKNFEVENKLDPERKVRLAQELSLQPRQVAVWFQNRRARWKTKQLERDYTALKTSYDSLRQDLDSLRRDNHALAAEVRPNYHHHRCQPKRSYLSHPSSCLLPVPRIKELKAKLGEEESYSEEMPAPESNMNPSEMPTAPAAAAAAALVYKDGSSDSDTSAVVNDETSPYHPMFATPPAIISTNSPAFTISAPNASQIRSSGATSARVAAASGFTFQNQVKAEEQAFDCFFSDEQPWYYYPDQWSWIDGGGGDHGNIGRREGLS